MTRRSLEGLGPVLFMGLMGVVIASFVGLCWQSDALEFVISLVGVVVFTGLTAYDAQRLHEMAASVPTERAGAYAITGALALYLDVVNLFLLLLRLFGRRE